ncbi:unnamed protein product [Macrosiphum euphorbiae]|uniref:THAP-type domain-containing protein n=1 Tax=Macrosiphum euphorbiae TaxID=13131 RepID=A0AAV0WPP8_9HEMI|nr:unnamed protein product [Macrosiphum euphorbiae]
MTCCVPSCKTKNKSTFSVPKDKTLLYLWEQSIGFQLKPISRICELHFETDDIIKTWESGQGISKYIICRKRSKLRPGAIPKNFNFTESVDSTSLDLQNCNIDELSGPSPKKMKISEDAYSVAQDHCYTAKSPTNTAPTEINKLGEFKEDLFRSLEKQLVLTEDLNIFIQVNGKEVAKTKLGLSQNYIPECMDDIENVLKLLDSAILCQGVESIKTYDDIQSTLGPKCEKLFDQWHHSSCTQILTNGQFSRSSNICLWCRRLLYIIKNKESRKSKRPYFSPNKKKTIKQLKKVKYVIKQKYSRASLKIARLQRDLIEIQNKMKDISDSSLNNMLNASNIPECQTKLVQEIFNAAKMKNPKNRKYSENWMLLCLLFQIRSPSGYKFLREQNILRLPCVNSIRKHLLAVKIGCGFDPNLFKLLQKKFSAKTENQKIGILLLDEMFLRESLGVNSRTLTYSGLEDYGDEIKSNKNSNLKANHGLVFMWQSLADNVVQPIAVFASHGPVKVKC